MKVLTLLGTRPELIKLSEIIKLLDKHTEHTFVHTGQNYDYELNEIFYEDLGLRKPDYFLNVAAESLGQTIANVLVKTEEVLREVKPDAVVILGDTNSAMGGIIAKRMKIPLFHLEAGNRCFDDNVPEEINRRILDHISDVNLVYTATQRKYLTDEGIAKDRVFIMGSPMKEVISKQILPTEISFPEVDVETNKYFLVSIHRDENTEIDANLTEVLATIRAVQEKYQLPVIVTTHPRLRKYLNVDEPVEGVYFMKPFGFSDYLALQQNAKCVISDSGTIAEESAILKFPAITIRNAIERPEAIDVGSILMSGVDKQNVLDCLDIVTAPTTIPADYDVDNCAERVVKVILGYTNYVNKYVWRK